MIAVTATIDAHDYCGHDQLHGVRDHARLTHDEREWQSLFVERIWSRKRTPKVLFGRISDFELLKKMS